MTLTSVDKKWLKDNLISRSDDDINSIKNLITVAVEEAIDNKKLVTKDDISHLPNKDEFYKETAKILKKDEDLETDNKSLNNRVSENSDEIEKLKEIHPDNKHIFEN